MIFLFEDIISGDFRYVNASDLSAAIKIYEEHYKFLNEDGYHIYVRID